MFNNYSNFKKGECFFKILGIAKSNIKYDKCYSLDPIYSSKAKKKFKTVHVLLGNLWTKSDTKASLGELSLCENHSLCCHSGCCTLNATQLSVPISGQWASACSCGQGCKYQGLHRDPLMCKHWYKLYLKPWNHLEFGNILFFNLYLTAFVHKSYVILLGFIP